MTAERLKNIIAKAPNGSGIYIFRDKDAILYVGKANNIKNRLKSYSRPTDTRIIAMIQAATTINFQNTDSDIEALILEAQLIKKLHPKFNIVLRDDKQYSYVQFSDDQFPRITIVRQPTSIQDIGPFTDSTALKITSKQLRRAFPYCTCKQLHNNYCLNYHIGNCPGFCCLKKHEATKDEIKNYDKNIYIIKKILAGKRNNIVASLKKRMIILGEKESFDEAIKIRNKLDAIKKIFRNSQIIDKRINDEDHNSKLETIAKFFGLTSAARIEGYDISNIQGTNAVGSMVTFKNGLADKSGYRKFKIRDSNASDDTRMLKEILTRRFRHSEWAKPNIVIIDGGKGQLNIAASIIPKDIILLSLTKNEKHVGSHIYVRGRKLPIKLDKLPADVRNIILNVDAEAHRFAIAYYRKLHRSMTTP